MKSYPASPDPTEPINAAHVIEHFDCGEPSLNDWLKTRALSNEGRASRTFVTCDGDRVTGFYCLSSGALATLDAPGKLKRTMPNPIPVAILGRLAVDKHYQGSGLGQMLLLDSLIKVHHASQSAGIRALIVHAKTEEVRPFYLRFGFASVPSNPLLMSLPIETLAAALERQDD
jgi:predicted N-acetyltransferase YhbS